MLPVQQSGQVHDSLHKLDIRNLQQVRSQVHVHAGIKLVGHKLACIAFSTKKLPDFLQQPVATEGIWL